jgi:exopolysaccharide biosynthesis polyprenyl glycosylphosphotransferase
VQIADVLVAFASLFVSYVLIWQQDPHFIYSPLTTRRSLQDFCSVVLLGFCWHAIFASAGLYRTRKSSYYSSEGKSILRASILSPLPTLLCWTITRDQRRSDFFHAVTISLLAAVLLPVMLLISRALLSFLNRHLWARTPHTSQLLIVGTNKRAMKFVEDIQRDPECGQTCIGFVDDGWFGETPREDSPIPLFGKIDDLPTLLREKAIDEVIITLPLATFYKATAGIVSLCETHGIRVRIVGQLFETSGTRPLLAPKETASAVTVHDPAWNEFSAFTKRLFDVVVSATMLAICLPVFLVIALAISLTSEGPVFFRQTRLGLGKREFQIYKFRTMVVNASEMLARLEHLNETGGPTFKLKNDPRITKVGAFLRKSSLDELPQLINVLIGDMSLVGPRPLPLRDYAGFSEDRHRRRFSVKPGITCLWQVMGRSGILFDEWMALDSQYIDQRTFWLDLKILIQTVPAVLRGSGAV